MRVQHGVVKALLCLSLAGCSGRTFSLTGAQLAAAEQKGFDRVMAQGQDTDTLFIAHEWQTGECKHFPMRGDFCFTHARATPANPWIPLNAHVRREKDGSWTLLGATWPRR